MSKDLLNNDTISEKTPTSEVLFSEHQVIEHQVDEVALIKRCNGRLARVDGVTEAQVI